MNEYPQSFDHMLAAWNEPNPDKVRQHLDLALSKDVYFVDPTIELHGIAAFEQMVHDVQAKIPGAVYSRVSAVDSHHNVFRYHWAIHLDGELLVPGFDVVEVELGKDEQVRVAKVYGFFGELESLG